MHFLVNTCDIIVGFVFDLCETGAKFLRNSYSSNSCELTMNVRVNVPVNVIFCESVCEFEHTTNVHFRSRDFC